MVMEICTECTIHTGRIIMSALTADRNCSYVHTDVVPTRSGLSVVWMPLFATGMKAQAYIGTFT